MERGVKSHQGASPKEPQRRDLVDAAGYRTDAHAVIIGINSYADSSVPDLAYARADAEALHAVLTDPTVGRFKPENVQMLLDEEATNKEIRSAIGTDLPKRVAPDDTVVLFFAGHGAPVIDASGGSADGIEKYLVPHDGEAQDLRATGVWMGDVERFFGWLSASQVLFFLDACYSGTAGGRSFKNPRYNMRASSLSDEFLSRLGTDGRMVVTACAANEVSLETPKVGQGLFTYHLVEGLKGAADTDGDGLVTLDELYAYLSKRVERDARQLGGSMNPVRSGAVQGTVYLTQYGQQGTPREEPEQAPEAPAPSGRIAVAPGRIVVERPSTDSSDQLAQLPGNLEGALLAGEELRGWRRPAAGLLWLPGLFLLLLILVFLAAQLGLTSLTGPAGKAVAPVGLNPGLWPTTSTIEFLAAKPSLVLLVTALGMTIGLLSRVADPVRRSWQTLPASDRIRGAALGGSLVFALVFVGVFFGGDADAPSPYSTSALLGLHFALPGALAGALAGRSYSRIPVAGLIVLLAGLTLPIWSGEWVVGGIWRRITNRRRAGVAEEAS